MRLCKRGHACIDLQLADSRILIDPGSFSDVPEPTGIDAVVLTHAHGDHAEPDLLRRVLTASPQAVVFGQASTLEAVASATDPVAADVRQVRPGSTEVAAGISLHFTGGRHAIVHSSFDAGENVGVIVADTLYHPGDSFTLPGADIAALALPVSGPWLKLGEVIDFVLATRPKLIVPIHDVFLSEAGMRLVVGRLSGLAQRWGGQVVTPALGESVAIDTPN